MSTTHFFNGKTIKLPGVYSAIKSVSPANFVAASYSKALIVNVNPEYAFGGSVRGELTKGGDAVYRMRTAQEAQSFLKAGYPWYLVDCLFNPSRLEGRTGISELYFLNALTSTAPSLTMTLSGSKSFAIKVKDECAWANGEKIYSSLPDSVADTPSENLKKGYALCIERGVRNKDKYVVQVWQGSFKGLHTDGLAWDGISERYCKPELVFVSPEVSTMQEFIDWAKTNDTFNAGFVLSALESDITFSTADLESNKFVLATGGTATYSAEVLDEALDLMRNGDYTTIVCLDKTGTTLPGDIAIDTVHARLQIYCQKETKFPKYLAIPGISTSSTNDLASNVAVAKRCNSERVWLIHGEARRMATYAPLGYRVFDSVAMTALIVGRILGLPPQVPATFKDLAIDGIENPLSSLQLEDALDAGILVANYDEDLQQYCILRGINTLQNNNSLQNPDGSTFSIQISRICLQLNTDLMVNAKKEIFSSNSGANRFTVSTGYLKNWMKVFLQSKVATQLQDNLIISHSDESVERKGDAYYCSYRFETNTEIAFVFFTGFAIN